MAKIATIVFLENDGATETRSPTQKTAGIRYKFIGHEPLDIYTESFPDEIHTQATAHGLKQKISDSYAEAKAECDVVCTSANAEKIALAMPGDKILFVPDILFAENLANELKGKK